MHNYEAAHGSLPPAAVTDGYGNPLLSWRVSILPYIEHEELYRRFRLDEPWDSPHNLALLGEMPRTYEARSRYVKAPPGTTCIKVFVGRDTPFERGKTVSLKNFPKGTSETLLLIEAGDPVPWTKPEDFEFDSEAPLPTLRGLWPDSIRSVRADGSRHDILHPYEEDGIKRLIRLSK